MGSWDYCTGPYATIGKGQAVHSLASLLNPKLWILRNREISPRRAGGSGVSGGSSGQGGWRPGSKLLF